MAVKTERESLGTELVNMPVMMFQSVECVISIHIQLVSRRQRSAPALMFYLSFPLQCFATVG